MYLKNIQNKNNYSITSKQRPRKTFTTQTQIPKTQRRMTYINICVGSTNSRSLGNKPNAKITAFLKSSEYHLFFRLLRYFSYLLIHCKGLEIETTEKRSIDLKSCCSKSGGT